jgi:hypothetical protein
MFIYLETGRRYLQIVSLNLSETIDQSQKEVWGPAWFIRFTKH